MARSRPYAFASFGALCAGALLLVACSGKTASPGGTTGQSEAVSAAAVSGPVTACGTGFAHPNVCCQAGPGQATACEVHPGAPFTACAAAATTYPDPRSCCPLDASGACVAPPPAPGPIPVDPWCIFPCPPGKYAPSGGPAGTCCETDATGAAICVGGGPSTTPLQGGVASASGSTGGGSPGGGPSTGGSSSGGSTGGSSSGGSVDAGVCVCNALCPAGQPCPPCKCPPPPPPPPPTCGQCPLGWQAPQGDPLLCCAEEASGVIACFSRGVPPPAPQPDAGPICDPNGPPPHAGCTWDLKSCQWDCPICVDQPPAPFPSCTWDTTSCQWTCPVCDPSGPAPNPACTWDLKTCAWDCPVCDPSSPAPNPSCKWDSTACVWLCL